MSDVQKTTLVERLKERAEEAGYPDSELYLAAAEEIEFAREARDFWFSEAKRLNQCVAMLAYGQDA